MRSETASAVAWVESPLQLVCAVEYAAASGTSLEILARAGGAQLVRTAQWLSKPHGHGGQALPIGTSIRHTVPAEFFARTLWRPRNVVVGDLFCGVVRASLAARSPTALTILDDGSTSLHIPRVVEGTSRLSRPGAESGPFEVRARQRFLELVASTRVRYFSMYDLGLEGHTLNTFDWLRACADDSNLGETDAESDAETDRAPDVGPDVGPDVILGSAAVVDGHMSLHDYLALVRALPRPATYFPHRRESEAHMQLISQIEGVSLRNTGLPIEITLAGARNLRIRSLASSATRSLALILGDRDCLVLTEHPEARAPHATRALHAAGSGSS